MDRPTRARFERFLDVMADKKDGPARLEALASAHFVCRLCGDLGDRKIAARVLRRQPYFGTDMCRRILGELRSEGWCRWPRAVHGKLRRNRAAAAVCCASRPAPPGRP